MLVENVQMVQEELDKIDETKYTRIKYDMSKCIRDAIINQHEILCEMKQKQQKD